VAVPVLQEYENSVFTQFIFNNTEGSNPSLSVSLNSSMLAITMYQIK
jgi:hypothetical protein